MNDVEDMKDIVKASKQYLCAKCHKIIEKGELYYYTQGHYSPRGHTEKCVKYYIYRYCLRCREQNKQLNKEGYRNPDVKEKIEKSIELIKKYGAMDAEDLRKMIDFPHMSPIMIARKIHKHFPRIKFERFIGGGNRKRLTGNQSRKKVRGRVVILYIDRDAMYRILKEKFNIQKISQILPRSKKWRTYDIICLTEPNLTDKNIIAYAGQVIDDEGNVIYSLSGSVRYPWQRCVNIDVIYDMVEWCYENVHHTALINIYTDDVDGILRRDVHDFISPSLVLRDTLIMRLRWFAKYNIYQLKDSEYFEKIRDIVIDEAHLHPDEALHPYRTRIDVTRHPVPREVVYGNRICGHIVGYRYISKRTIRHYCFKYNGWGIQKEIIEKLDRENVNHIDIIYYGENEIRIYTTSLHNFKSNAILACLSEIDGEQMFLPEEFWYIQRIPLDKYQK